ncbi:MAG: hypothetical protein AAB522_03095 [Patescibacteria group bacterium]
MVNTLNHKSKFKIIKKFALLFLILIFTFLIFSPIYAQTASNAAAAKTLKNIGFIQDNIWFSKDPFFEGDKIRIYTAVFNGSKYDFKGVVEFFNNGKSIGKSSFALTSGAFQALWMDWTAEGGEKRIYANITSAKISLPGGVEEAVILENVKTGEMETFVDKDSDGDGIGDKNDPKDDRIKEEKKEEKSAQSVDAADSKAQVALTSGGNVFAKLPDSQEAASVIRQSVSKLNNFLYEQKKKAEAQKEELQKKLGEEKSLLSFEFLGKKNNEYKNTEPEENKDFLRFYLLALSALIFSLEYKVIVYLLGIYIAYRILKFFVRKIFYRHVDN